MAHDASTNIAKQKQVWDDSSPNFASGRFDAPGVGLILPLNVKRTYFKDSRTLKQLQLADVLAGAMSYHAKSASGTNSDFTEQLKTSGIENLSIDAIWPSPEVTPEALGKKTGMEM